MKAKKKTFTAAEKYKVALEAIKGIMSIAQIGTVIYGRSPIARAIYHLKQNKVEMQSYIRLLDSEIRSHEP